MNNQVSKITGADKFAFVNTSFDLTIPEQKALYEKLNELSNIKNEKKATMIRKSLIQFLATA